LSVVAKHVGVTGRVQGVFFRAWTRDQARSLGLGGWVRNCANGSVEAHVEGDETAVRQLIDKMRVGPPSARVDKVAVETADPQRLSGFEVRH
jgi:acylphosphatase